MDINEIDGGVTAPKGYYAAGVACGLKKNGEKDLAVVMSECPAAVTGMYTKNTVKGHSLKLTIEHAKKGFVSAVVINSGNANACLGEQGDKDAKEMAELTARLLNLSPAEVLTGSTGVIGQPLNMPLLRAGIKLACESLSPDGGSAAAEAIMTTDKKVKQCAVEVEVQNEKIRIGGMAKGSGMIHPNMATMICVLTTDINIKQSLIHSALAKAVETTFNRISVDGDTSVCDMVLLLANGNAENEGVTTLGPEYDDFLKALTYVCSKLSKAIVQDGEGTTKLIDIHVKGAASRQDAIAAAAAVARSPLVKTAIYGADANWGRIITAVGYSGAKFDPLRVDIEIGGIVVCKNGSAVEFDEVKARSILENNEIQINIDLNSGSFEDHYMTSDLTEEYIKINSNYRS